MSFIPELQKDLKLGITLSPQSMKRVSELFRFLLSLIPGLVKYVQLEGPQKMVEDTSVWKLVNYFRLIRSLPITKSDKLLVITSFKKNFLF